MLIDDSSNDNFFHERTIVKSGSADRVISMESGTDALEYLRSQNKKNGPYPELIFLDINMPGMNGWDFLEEYNTLDPEVRNSVIVIMLTTSDNPDDKMKAMALNGVSDFKTKPLTRSMLDEIFEKYSEE
jgi:CheY-like chemotaxis protein